MVNPSSIIESVKKIAEEAGKIVLNYYDSDFSYSIGFKSDSSPVTIADTEANEYIVKKLFELYSGIPIIAEESEIVDFAERKNWQCFWMVDPLDGTKEFIKKNGEFTVNIALIKNKTPVLGVVYVPVSNIMYWAIKNEGAYMSSNGVVKRIYANKIDMNGKNMKIVLSRSHFNKGTEEYLNKFENPQIIQRGSSLKFMDIASGQADLYFRTNSIMEWDTAASHVILKESGADMINLKTGKKILYNKKNLKSPGFIVCSVSDKENHD